MSNLLDPVEHLPLHPVLQLPPPDHRGENLLHLALRVFLLLKVGDDAVLRDLGSDWEPLLQLLLNPITREIRLSLDIFEAGNSWFGDFFKNFTCGSAPDPPQW